MSGIPADRYKIPRAFWGAVEKFGVPATVLLRQARLPTMLHLNDRALVTTPQYFALWRALEDLMRDPSLGLKLARATDTSVHPPASLAAFYARDFRDGLSRLARFKRLCTPEKLLMSEHNGNCTIVAEWIYAAEPAPAISVDVDFASLIELGGRGTGQHLTPARVTLRRADPGDGSHQMYFGCPIDYGAECDQLLLRSADLDLSFPGHNPDLLALITPALTSALHEIEVRTSVRERVKVILKRNLASGRPELPAIAAQMGLSDRTHQRRITEASTSFRELLNEAPGSGAATACRSLYRDRRSRLFTGVSGYEFLLPSLPGMGGHDAELLAGVPDWSLSLRTDTGESSPLNAHLQHLVRATPTWGALGFVSREAHQRPDDMKLRTVTFEENPTS